MSWAAESTTTMIVKPQQFSINTKFPATNTVPDLRFQEYTRQLTLLRNFQETLRRQGLNQAFQTVDFDDLTETSRLPGKNHARVVVRDPMRTRHVFKGFDFEYFVQHGPDFHEHQRNTMLHEIRTLAALPIHPNIMPCPDTLAIVRDPGGCARTFHMDVKPGNILIDDTDGIRLIDWEQSGVSMFTHALEATIDQEAWEDVDSSVDTATQTRPRIIYTPHVGPSRSCPGCLRQCG
ncbi:hypothetical protein BN1708_011780 [Verticillium longisporum]|nr:hypothetical protein BN1708_011780 [Verticillium longisporum]